MKPKTIGLIAICSMLSFAGGAVAKWEGYYLSRPPERFTGDVEFVLKASNMEAVTAACGRGYIGCMSETGVLTLPNPCLFNDDYAKLVCHEMGHINGWAHGHGHGFQKKYPKEGLRPFVKRHMRSLGFRPEGA